MTNDDPWRVGPGGRLGHSWRKCLDAAAAAPSVHNTQPWRFRVANRTVDVLADRSRQLDVVDLRGRELLISVGAAIFNLRTAILDAGRYPLLQLWPDPAAPDVVARIGLGGVAAGDVTIRALATAMPARRTNRQPFADRPISDQVTRDLSAAARVEGADLAAADETGRMLVLGVVRRAEEHLRNDPQYRAELARWTQTQAGRRDGVPAEAFGPWTAVEHAPIRQYSQQPVAPGCGVLFEPQPNIAVLYTYGDTPQQWVRAGQALERVLLTATVRGVAATLMTQPMELPGLRQLLADPRDDRIVAQAALRFGYAASSPATPRRPLRELLVHEGPARSMPATGGAASRVADQ
jgi:nitroreductase